MIKSLSTVFISSILESEAVPGPHVTCDLSVERCTALPHKASDQNVISLENLTIHSETVNATGSSGSKSYTVHVFAFSDLDDQREQISAFLSNRCPNKDSNVVVDDSKGSRVGKMFHKLSCAPDQDPIDGSTEQVFSAVLGRGHCFSHMVSCIGGTPLSTPIEIVEVNDSRNERALKQLHSAIISFAGFDFKHTPLYELFPSPLIDGDVAKNDALIFCLTKKSNCFGFSTISQH